MTTLRWFAQGIPKAQPRPRAARIGGFVRVYDAATAEGWKCEVLRALREQCGQVQPTELPVTLTVKFLLPRPKAHYKGGNPANALKDTAPERHTQKPDTDNLIKAVKDCLTTVVWRDDSQVWAEVIEKAWANGGAPGAWITVTY